MKKMRILCLFLCAVALLGLLGLPARAEEDQSVLNGCHSTDAAAALAPNEQKLDTAKAAILYERNSDTLIYSWNGDARIYPASMVKLMTALVALDYGDPAATVTVTKRALSYVAMGSVSAKLAVGEQLTLEALLYCMMVASANDAATVIAEYIAGSQDGFIQLMNEKATALGCKDTHFSNTHGLHDENTYTTARDLCRILDHALDNPVFKALFTAKSYTVPATNKSEPRQIITSNYMLTKEGIERYYHKYYDSRVTGGKTGATDAAGRCLAVTAEKNGMEILAVVMGATPTYEPDGLSLKTFGSFEEMKVLLDYAFQNFEYRQVFYQDQVISQHPVAGGANDLVTFPEAPLSTILPVGADLQELSWVYGTSGQTIAAPVVKGERISSLQLWYHNLCLAQTNLVAANSVAVYSKPSDSPSGPTPPEENEGSWKQLLIVFGILLGAAFSILLLLVLIRQIRRAALRARMKRRRMERRRRQ